MHARTHARTHTHTQHAHTHTGTLQNESRELERRIEQEEARANVLNMEQVIKDLEEIKAENYALAERAGQLK